MPTAPESLHHMEAVKSLEPLSWKIIVFNKYYDISAKDHERMQLAGEMIIVHFTAKRRCNFEEKEQQVEVGECVVHHHCRRECDDRKLGTMVYSIMMRQMLPWSRQMSSWSILKAVLTMEKEWSVSDLHNVVLTSPNTSVKPGKSPASKVFSALIFPLSYGYNIC